MQCNDFVVVVSLVLIGSFLLIARSSAKDRDCDDYGYASQNQQAPTMQPKYQPEPTEHFTMNHQQARVRPMRRFEPASNNVREMLNSATVIDGDKPCDLFPEANACKNLPEDWKEMFSHAENTLASENFVEPSYEYAIGTLNVPKKWLTQDLRGAPEVPQYDNLTPFNNSAISNLDLSEKYTRRAGEL